MPTAGVHIMGVLNVTPDSFSDGGRYLDSESAVAHGELLFSQGADIVDVGGESTRPGARRISAEEEQSRVIPVVSALAHGGITTSVDTMRAETARAAVEAGASIVNDVSGGQADPQMYRTVADLDCTYVVMHWRAHSVAMDEHATYAHAGRESLEETLTCVRAAVAAGVNPDRIIIDPGLGFAKDAQHNWDILSDLGLWRATGFRLLVGASRKRFLGALLADAQGEPRPVDHRDAATAALSLLVAQSGAWGLRVHDVVSTCDALKVWERWSAESGGDHD